MSGKLRQGLIIEARMTSTRLPGKVLMPACGKPLLELEIERLRRVRNIDVIILATTSNVTDDPLEALAARLNIACFRGSEDDVLGRVLGAAKAHDLDIIVEIMGDCPLIDPASVDDVINAWHEDATTDYASAALSDTYPVGTEAQVYPTSILANINDRDLTAEEREHVTLHIYRNPEEFGILPVVAPEIRRGKGIFLTLDEHVDYTAINAIFEALYPDNPDFAISDIVALLKSRPELAAATAAVHRTKVSH